MKLGRERLRERFRRLRARWCPWLLLGAMRLSGAESIQLSFLEDREVLGETLAVLADAGCEAAALGAFERLVLETNARHSFVFSEDDPVRGGYREMDSVAELLALGPPGYSGLIRNGPEVRRHSLMCFDLALVLLRGGPVSADAVWNDFDEKHFVQTVSHRRGGLWRQVGYEAEPASFEGGASLLQPLAGYQRATGFRERTSQEEALALSLRAARRVPGHYANVLPVIEQLFDAKRALWKRDELYFSDQIRIVLAQYINLRERFVAVDHIGLAVPFEDRWMYLEKDGTLGPIVRINFRSLPEIGDYILGLFQADQYDPASPLHEAAFLVSVNDELVATRLRSTSEIRLELIAQP